MFFDKGTYDQFQLSKEEYALLKEKEDKTDKTDKDAKEKKDSALENKLKEPFKMDLTDLDTRRIRLTPGFCEFKQLSYFTQR